MSLIVAASADINCKQLEAQEVSSIIGCILRSVQPPAPNMPVAIFIIMLLVKTVFCSTAHATPARMRSQPILPLLYATNKLLRAAVELEHHT